MIGVEYYRMFEQMFGSRIVSKPTVDHAHQVQSVKVVRLAPEVVLDFRRCRLELRQDNQHFHIRKSGDVIAWVEPQRLAELINCLPELGLLRVGKAQPS